MSFAFESTFLKFGMRSIVVLTVFSFLSCKQTTAEKNTGLIKEAMPAIVAQKDSLNTELQITQQAFQAFKTKTSTASALLNQPEYSQLSRNVDGIIMKSEHLNELLPGIESKLQALESQNLESPTESVQHEIEVLKELLRIQRGRMTNYQQTYQKYEHQIDSIQSVIK